MVLDRKIEVNKKTLESILDVNLNFDIQAKEMIICGHEACMFFIDGFAKDDIMEKIMEFLYSVDNDKAMQSAQIFAKSCIPYGETAVENDIDKIVTEILAGAAVIVIDGFENAVIVDIRTYPQRDSTEPEKDKTFRGSKDGFVEGLVSNVALIRRRIRTPMFCAEAVQIGRTSKTDIAICYIKDRVDKNLLDKIHKKLNSIDTDALTMNQETLAELLIKKKWYNPFPKFKYTERPDAAAAQILEGDIVILVDNSPSVMLLPTNFFDVMEEANDYYFPPITGSYLRLTRYVVMLVTLLLTPIWVLLVQNPDVIPNGIKFILPKDPVNIPIVVQLLILEISIDGVRLASLNTPTMLTTTLSMLGAVVVGDFAVQSGWFLPETMLYMAFVALVTYSQPCYELGYALKFMRIIMLIATALFNYWGFFASLALVIIILVSNKTVSGKSYMYPLIPFNAKALKKKLMRIRLDR